FSLEDLAGLARLDADRNGLIDSAEWTRVVPAIAAYVGDHFRIEGCRSEGDPERVPPAARSSDLRTPITLVLRYLPAQPLDRLKIRCDLFREHGGNPRHIAEVPGGETVIFDNDRREADRLLTPENVRWWWITALAFLPAAAVVAFRIGSL